MNERHRPRNDSFRGRTLLTVGVLATITAGALGVAAAVNDFDETDTVVLDIEPVTAEEMPVTVPTIEADGATPPRRDETPTPSTEPAEQADSTSLPATTTTTVPSALAGMLGERGSAIPEQVEPRPRPVTLTIADTDLWAPVRAVGLEADGQLEIPGETEVGWYEYGATPGRAGATVLAAHVTWNDTIGPFYRLGDLDPGAGVEVRLDDGTTRTYEVVERTMYDKDSLPRQRIWRNTGDESLVLITCGGSFNPEIRRYRQNIVVYAVPVG